MTDLYRNNAYFTEKMEFVNKVWKFLSLIEETEGRVNKACHFNGLMYHISQHPHIFYSPPFNKFQATVKNKLCEMYFDPAGPFPAAKIYFERFWPCDKMINPHKICVETKQKVDKKDKEVDNISKNAPEKLQWISKTEYKDYLVNEDKESAIREKHREEYRKYLRLRSDFFSYTCHEDITKEDCEKLIELFEDLWYSPDNNSEDFPTYLKVLTDTCTLCIKQNKPLLVSYIWDMGFEQINPDIRQAFHDALQYGSLETIKEIVKLCYNAQLIDDEMPEYTLDYLESKCDLYKRSEEIINYFNNLAGKSGKITYNIFKNYFSDSEDEDIIMSELPRPSQY